MINVAFILNQGAFDDVFGAECVDALHGVGRVIGPLPCSAETLVTTPAKWLGEVEVLFTSWGSPLLDAALLARMPRLRAVFYGAGTLRFLVTEACWERKIIFSTAATLNALPTAEFTLGAILLSLKRAWTQASHVRTLRTFPARPLPSAGGSGSTIGLVSLGLVGRRVAELLRLFEVNVLAHDPFAPSALVEALGVRSTSLEEVFAESDVVSLHTPLLPETQGFVNARLLQLLKPNATFINTGRGGLVNEPDLFAFLRARPDVQAIIDVTDPEPPPTDSPFYDLPNVFLTPHIAGSLGSECRRMGRAMVTEFLRFARCEPLQHAVTREQLARRA